MVNLPRESKSRKLSEPDNTAVPEPQDLQGPDGLRAKKRWKALVGTLTAEKSFIADSLREQFGTHEGLLAEVRKARKDRAKEKVRESVLEILRSKATLKRTKVFENQKYSAKEILRERRALKDGSAVKLEYDTQSAVALARHNLLAKQKYPITPEIRAKLKDIKAKNLESKQKQQERKNKKPCILQRWFCSTVLGQTLRADPRFYSMDIHDHVPDLCRRCRRPLRDTLEGRFTVIGILFCILLPLIGILLLFANRDFNCVVCEERYVYGDFKATAGVDEKHRRKTEQI